MEKSRHGQLYKLLKLGVKPPAWLQSPHLPSMEQLSHQAAGASLNDRNTLWREECSSKTNIMQIVFCICSYSRLSICFSFITYPISSSVWQPLSISLPPIDFATYLIMLHCFHLWDIIDNILKYLKYMMWWFNIYILCEGIPPIELYTHPTPHILTFLGGGGGWAFKFILSANLYYMTQCYQLYHHVIH